MPTTTIKASASRDTLRLEPALGADWRVAVSFVDGGDDPIDVSAYAWRLDFKRDRSDSTEPLFSLTEGDGIDVTGAAAGVLVLTGAAANIAALRTIVKGDLVGTKAGDVWPALPIELRVDPLATRSFDDGQVDDLGAGEVALAGGSGSVVLSVTQVAGSGTVGGGGSDVTFVSQDDTTITLDVAAGVLAAEDDTTITLDL